MSECKSQLENGRYSSTSSVTLTHSSSGEIEPEQQQMDLTPSLLFSLQAHVDLFMLKFKQLEAQLALTLAEV